MAILINNLQEIVPVSDDLIALLERVLQQGLADHAKPQAEVSVVLVTDDYIKELNLEYRGLDQPTDVLSFAMEEGEAAFSTAYLPADLPELLGDIYISVERAVEQAKEYGNTLAREICYLAIHGLLHLLGFDHQSPEQTALMRAAEEKILLQFALGRTAD
ncbi:MAG: rRNA maturation RNase YbeY [Bacillota bacterium]